MNKLCIRNFILTACMILISFSVLGGAFLGLSYSYTISERTDALETDAQYVSILIGNEMEWGMSASDERMVKTMQAVALISGVDVMLTDVDGQVIYYTDGVSGEPQEHYIGMSVSPSVITQMQGDGAFSASPAWICTKSPMWSPVIPSMSAPSTVPM